VGWFGPYVFSKKMSEEEKASGISVEELTEKESLIEEFVEREDTIQAKAKSASNQQLKDNETAEDIKKKSDGEPLMDQETQFRRRWRFSKTS